MSECVVPNWNVRHQKQQQLIEGEESSISSHVHIQPQNPSPFVPMSNHEVAELTWKNGQLAMHGFGVFPPSVQTKPTWGTSGDTLESLIHQATICNKQNLNNIMQHDHQNPENVSSIVASSGRKRDDCSGHVKMVPGLVTKRMRLESDQCGKKFSSSIQEEGADHSACASASAAFCRENDTTMMTWPSFESPHCSLKTKTTDDQDDSACQDGSENRDEDHGTKGGTVRSHSTRRNRAADIHNQSERRRRDRINQKMKALQKLVPNASKTDKASMLDEVIEYLKQLQAQVQMMSAVRNMPQMIMPLGMQQQLQMSLLARMAGMGVGFGLGMGMVDMSNVAQNSVPHSLPALIHPNPLAAAAAAAAAASARFAPPPFVVPPTMFPGQAPPQANPDGTTTTSVPLNDPYCTFLAQQSMNIDLYNRMAGLYRQTAQATTSPSQSTHFQGEQ